MFSIYCTSTVLQPQSLSQDELPNLTFSVYSQSVFLKDWRGWKITDPTSGKRMILLVVRHGSKDHLSRRPLLQLERRKSHFQSYLNVWLLPCYLYVGICCTGHNNYLCFFSIWSDRWILWLHLNWPCSFNFMFIVINGTLYSALLWARGLFQTPLSQTQVK